MATVSSLDPKDPLVLDTRAVARRPGTMAELVRTVPAPSGLGLDVVGVPENAPVELDVRLESVVEGVLVSGSARAQAIGECVRCLDPIAIELDLDVQELFAYPDAAAADAEEIAQVEDELVDFRPVLRDAVVLALPLQPVCRDDCLGLCPTCGARLNDDPEHHHDQVDPRWAALGELTGLRSDSDRTGQDASQGVSEN
ncbi:MAG TPA: YceD family protein [Actinomycetes bacterium]|nr:YceD family protein [Actinomycetes bacterium]